MKMKHQNARIRRASENEALETYATAGVGRGAGGKKKVLSLWGMKSCRLVATAGIVAAAGLLSTGQLCAQSLSDQALTGAIDDAGRQARVMLQSIAEAKEQPGTSALVSPKTLEDGKLQLVKAKDWTSGFFPGELWYLYQHSGDEKIRAAAESLSAAIEPEQYNGGTHDMGFKIYLTAGHGYRLTDNPHYKEVVIQAAKTLATRFHPRAGVIRSWDHNRDKWEYPVIIDNMMNLELLFAATRLTGDSSFYRIAVSHADRTMENHFRPDYGTYHVVDYDSATGGIIKKTTHQGYADNSTWSRGEGWALYGYTMCYRETGNEAYLQQAEQVANFIFTHPNLPDDLVPYWDFDDPEIPLSPRDASAAAICASGLLELSGYSKENGARYRDLAEKILANLTRHYRAAPGEDKGFVLLHSTGGKPTNTDVDVPLIYADYYYLEALLRLEQLRRQP